GPERFLSTFPLLQQLVGMLGPAPPPGQAAAIGELAARLWALRQMSMRVAERLQAGEAPATEAALVKDLGTRFESEVIEVARDLIPPLSASKEFRRLYWEGVLAAPGFTLRGGTNEILRGIVARSLKNDGPLRGNLDAEGQLL